MAKAKPELSELSINQLATLSGSTHRTIRKRLADLAPVRVTGNALLYNPKDALPLIYLGSDKGESLDLSQERARLAKVQTERQALLLERDRGRLIEIEAVGEVVADEYARVRSRLLALPNRLAAAFPEHRANVFAKSEAIVHEALEELSQDVAGELTKESNNE